MNVTDKLAVFSRITMQQVEDECLQLKNELDETFRARVEEAARGLEKQSQERIRNEKYKAERAKNLEVVAAATEAKQLRVDLRNRLTDLLFADVQAKIEAFVLSPEYAPWLKSHLQAACQEKPGVFAYVQLMERDMSLVLPTDIKILKESTKEDFLGGFRLFSANRKMFEDFTLLLRLQEAQQGSGAF